MPNILKIASVRFIISYINYIPKASITNRYVVYICKTYDIMYYQNEIGWYVLDIWNMHAVLESESRKVNLMPHTNMKERISYTTSHIILCLYELCDDLA